MRSWSHGPWLDEPSQSTVDTIVIGGGQAGLAMSWFPGQAGRDHVVLERRTGVGGGWQDRWDGFRLINADSRRWHRLSSRRSPWSGPTWSS